MTDRDATVADAPVLAALFRDCFTATFAHLYAPADLHAFLGEFPPARWAAELADPAYAVRLAIGDDGPVGYAKLGPPALPGAPATAIELRQLYLLAAAQGGGHGPALMEWTLATARTSGATELWLSVFVDNTRARRFYGRYGFEDRGRYAFRVGANEDEDRLMRLVL